VSNPRAVKRLPALVGTLGLVAAALVGCSSGTSARLSVASGVAAIGQPSPVTATHLSPGRTVSVVVTSTDDKDVRWKSVTKLRADDRGQLTFDAGTLIASMTPLGPDPVGAYFWSLGKMQFRVSIGGAAVTIWRRATAHAFRAVRVTADGLVGTFYSAGLPGRHSAVLMIGGSEGGQPGPLVPGVIAGYGHPVLSLAYFKAPGVPQTLKLIPLEYFAKALRWLARQPGVDPNHLVVDGASRGGEAALLIGATYPTLVHGVIARVPSNVVLCDYPGCTTSAWSLKGKPVAFTSAIDNPEPTDNSGAVIHVERIDGPVLLNCGGLDNEWTSCNYAKAVMSRLARGRYPHSLQVCSRCDHHVGRGLPDEPLAGSGVDPMLAADIKAYPAFFKATLDLLG
jgi:hypothetical protein